MQSITFSEDFLFKVILVFFIALTLIVICFAVIGFAAYRSEREDRAKDFNDALDRLQVLRIVMAVIMVFAATMLAATKIISGDAVVSIISGIVGYVLGALAKSKPKNKNESDAVRGGSMPGLPAARRDEELPARAVAHANE